MAKKADIDVWTLMLRPDQTALLLDVLRRVQEDLTVQANLTGGFTKTSVLSVRSRLKEIEDYLVDVTGG